MRKFLVVVSVALFLAPISQTAFASDAGTVVEVSAPVDAVVAPAATEPVVEGPAKEIESVTEAVSTLGEAVTAFKSKNYAMFAGFVLFLAVWACRKFLLKKLDGIAVLWTTLAVGVASAVAMNLTAGMAWLDALLLGVTASLSSVGWDQFFKKLKPKKEA